MKRHEQRMQALTLANERRAAGKHFKESIIAGRVSSVDAVRYCRESMPVSTLLKTIPSIGVRKASRTLVVARVAAHVRMRDLTDAQRERIIDALNVSAPTVVKR